MAKKQIEFIKVNLYYTIKNKKKVYDLDSITDEFSYELDKALHENMKRNKV